MSEIEIQEQSLTPPKTPERQYLYDHKNKRPLHPWPEPELAEEDINPAKRQRIGPRSREKEADDEFKETHQNVLLLHAPKQKYIHTTKQPIPELKNEREMLVSVEAVGLNPIDWKAPDFGFGLPALPCISGRDLAGKVVKTSQRRSRFQKGDKVMAISTDYRDSRKAAYQQYAIVSDFNACRLPSHLSVKDAAPLGVAFAAAALGLAICMGIHFPGLNETPTGPDLLKIVRGLSRDALPKDIHAECFDGISFAERATKGDWIAIWGGSSATGCVAVQLAKLAGLKVIAIVDLARSGERMLKHGADLLVDRLDEGRAIEIVKGITKGELRFGLDTRGKETSKLLAQAMEGAFESTGKRAHLVGLTGLPKEPTEGVVYHSVPIKAFHEAPLVGEGLMIWLEKLLEKDLLLTPDIHVAQGGLEGINDALDKLRDGTVNGPRIVVPLI